MREALIFAAVMATTGLALAAPPAHVIELQSQDIRLPGPGRPYTGTGADILNANCTMCHSADFIERQPKLSEAAWKAEVLKMKNVFGAAIAPENVPAIVKALLDRQAAPPAAPG